MSSEATPLISLENISKHYGATAALSNVHFACYPGEVHAVLGENGAGKSTLMKLLAGVIQPTQGQLYLDAKPRRLASPKQAIDCGLICMFQELSLVPDLTVRENFLLGGAGATYGFSNQTDLVLARTLLDRLDGAAISFSSRIGQLTLAERQQVEIAKALSRNPRLLILDEATSALNASVVDKVFDLIREKRDAGISILFISHRFHEVEAIADKISVFRNGEHVDTFRNGQYDYSQIINMMVGQTLSELFPSIPQPKDSAPVVLNVESMAWNNEIADVSFDAREGEIIGLGGLDGQGQALVMQGIFGLLKQASGTVYLHGSPTSLTSPRDAKSTLSGLAWVPEDRKSEGLILAQSIRQNIELAALGHASKPTQAIYEQLMSALELKYRSIDQPVSDLSGGNQQKVALIKWLVLSPKCLLLSDPTRGIDVKTKTQIYALLEQLASDGMAVVLLSSDYEELINLCHRVHVFYNGVVVDSLEGDRLSAQNIIAASLNLHNGGGDNHA